MLKQLEKIVKAKSITCAPKPQRLSGRPHRKGEGNFELCFGFLGNASLSCRQPSSKYRSRPRHTRVSTCSSRCRLAPEVLGGSLPAEAIAENTGAAESFDVEFTRRASGDGVLLAKVDEPIAPSDCVKWVVFAG